MTELLRTLGIIKPVKSIKKSQITKTQKTLKTHLVNKAKTACMTLIQRKKPLVTQKTQKLNISPHRPRQQ